MNQATVVPNNELVYLPVMFIRQVCMDGHSIEFFNQSTAFFVRHTHNVLCMVA